MTTSTAKMRRKVELAAELPPEETATPEEIAAEYRVKRSTVMRWARDGLIPVISAAGRGAKRFDRDAVRKAISR